MDHGHFDDLTRSVAGEGGTRRALLRFLAGGALGGLAARIGLDEDAAANPKRKRNRDKRKRNKRDKKPKNPQPPQPSPCGADQSDCGNGLCVDPLIKCCPDEKRCGDNQCIPKDRCCPGEKPCDGACVPDEFCCFDDPAPLCNGCQTIVCENGEYVCQTVSQGEDCGSGACCPTHNPLSARCDGGRCCRHLPGTSWFVCD